MRIPAHLSYKRIRRYLVWRLKRLEARDFSHVRIEFLIHVNNICYYVFMFCAYKFYMGSFFERKTFREEKAETADVEKTGYPETMRTAGT